MQMKIPAHVAAIAFVLVVGLVSFVETTASLAAAVLAPWAALASVSPVALATIFFALVAPVSPVAAAPTPGAAAIAVAAVVNGLPSCAKPVMNSMVFRAASFGCDTADGTPDVACLCRSRPFKRLAKGGVHAECPDQADLGASREWAITRCTAALTAAAGQGISRVPAAGTNGTASPVRQPNAAAAAAPPTATVIAAAVFDLDDDEDETSGAALVCHAGALALLPVTVAAAGAVLLL